MTACSDGSPAQIENIEAKAWKLYQDTPTAERAPFIDFSYAGAHYGQKPLEPTIKTIFKVGTYGAYPDDKIDDTDALQATIEMAQKAGGGIVQFEQGQYLLNESPSKGPLRIRQSRIVLRGSQAGQTVLTMQNSMPPKQPGKLWTGGAMIVFQPDIISAPSSSKVEGEEEQGISVTGPAKTGDWQLNAEGASEVFKAGDIIKLEMRSQKAREAFLKGKPVRDVWTRIHQEGIMVRDLYEIAKIEGDHITLSAPLLVDVEGQYGWRIRRTEMIQHVGFENICVQGQFTEKFEHHKNATHDSGFRALELVATQHSWVRDNCFENVTTAVSIKGGLTNTILRNDIKGNAGHFGFQAEFSTRTLFLLNSDNSNTGQFHGPSASHMSVGTVYSGFYGRHSPGIDAHGTFPRHTLFDNVDLSGFGSWGGNVKNLPNHLEGLVFWNFTQHGDRVGNHYKGILDFWQLPQGEQKYGFLTAIDPMVVGYIGPIREVERQHVGHVESLSSHVFPQSLYLAQLNHRLGYKPDWITKAYDQWKSALDINSKK